MSEFLVNSGSGVTEMAVSTAYALGDRIVINRASTGSNYLVARRYVWECTTAGTTDASHPASYSASYTPDSSTLTSGTAVFTCRNPGFSSGSTKDWTFATIFLLYAYRAAITDGDIIKVHKTHSESWSESINSNTWGPQASISVLCVDKDASEALAVMDFAYGIGTTSFNYFSIVPVADVKLYFYGVVFRSSYLALMLGISASHQSTFESCGFEIQYSGSYIRVGNDSTGVFATKLKNCVFKFSEIDQYVQYYSGEIAMEGCSISAVGSAPNSPFRAMASGPAVKCNGCDWSNVGTSLLGNLYQGFRTFEFSNCKLPAVPVWYTGTPSVTYLGGGEAFVFNCSSGDTHYNFGYYNNLGSVEAVTSIYADDGALYDGTNHVTWKVMTTAYCSQKAVFETPWLEKYHAGSSAITPSLEILRDGSTTAYQDDEVWGEFSYQGTTGSARASFVNDRGVLLGTPANQAAGVGLTGWTGEAASAWSGKLAPASAITPAEIGMLRARVCVAEPSITVYVDPKIRT